MRFCSENQIQSNMGVITFRFYKYEGIFKIPPNGCPWVQGTMAVHMRPIAIDKSRFRLAFVCHRAESVYIEVRPSRLSTPRFLFVCDQGRGPSTRKGPAKSVLLQYFRVKALTLC
jgi:hypothetical protein